MGVYIPYTSYDYTKMQGPAPSGFHVPLNSEWVAVKTIWTALGGGSSDGTNFGIALKLPFAGRRNRSNSNVIYQGSYGNYWSLSRYSTGSAYNMSLLSTVLDPQSADSRAFGFPVRCFKNSPTVPTSSWTKLYGTSIESGGIFWGSADGLISLSSDGQTWITIADKNLGATTVWNSGDTLSEDNCGKYYQRGNNYGFPFTGSVTTSSTQVDASNYGPGNYYSSSTFITRSSSPYRWDTTDNGNLRGGVTGVNPMSELKNAYIGEVWTPGSNTMLYLPMETDYQDHSSNGYTMTLNSGSLTKDGYSYFLSGSQYIYPKLNNNVISESSLVGGSFPYTISTWAKSVSGVSSTTNYSPVRISQYYNNGAISGASYIIYGTSSRWEVFNNVDSGSTVLTISDSTQRHLYTIVIKQSSQDIYQDTTKVGTFTKNYVLSTYTGTDAPFCFQSRNYDYGRNKGGTLGITVVEKGGRDIDKITTFYNQTKANYGL